MLKHLQSTRPQLPCTVHAMSNQSSHPKPHPFATARPTRRPPPLPTRTSSTAQQGGGTPGRTQIHNYPGAARTGQTSGSGSQSHGAQGFPPGRSILPIMEGGVWGSQSSQQGRPPFQGTYQRTDQQRHYPEGSDSFLPSFSRRNSAESSESPRASAFPSNVQGMSHPSAPSNIPSGGHGGHHVPSSSRRSQDHSYLNMESSGSESGSPRSSTSSYRTAPEPPTSPTSPTFRHDSQSIDTGAPPGSTSGTTSTSRSKQG